MMFPAANAADPSPVPLPRFQQHHSKPYKAALPLSSMLPRIQPSHTVLEPEQYCLSAMSEAGSKPIEAIISAPKPLVSDQFQTKGAATHYEYTAA